MINPQPKLVMKISLCMIVKDEIDCLERCLDSVEELVDEICIVDTGSSDGTLEFINGRVTDDRKTPYIVREIDWSGFSDARNACQDLASGDWILILDADEYLVDTSGWPDMLRAMATGKHDAIALLVHNELPENQILSGDNIYQIRLFERRPEIRWEGSVHNQIATALVAHAKSGKEADFYQAHVMLNHRGYNLSKDKLKKKYALRMDLLRNELKNAATPKIKAYYQFQTANALFMQEQYVEAYELLTAADLDVMTNENAYSTCIMAVHCAHTTGNDGEGIVFAKKMMEINPGEAMSFLMIGLSLLAQGGQAQGAYNFLGSAINLTALPKMSFKYQLDAPYIAAAAGEAALQLNRLGDAKALFQMHLTKYQTPRILDLESKIIPVGSPLPEDFQGVPQTVEELNGQANPTEPVVIRDSRTIGSR